jgi:hypothetical protein
MAARGVGVAGKRVEQQDGVAAGRVQLAVRLEGQRQRRQARPAAQRERLGPGEVLALDEAHAFEMTLSLQCSHSSKCKMQNAKVSKRLLHFAS